MITKRREILDYLLTTLEGLSQDWDYQGTLGPETRLFTDLGMESLDLVVLATTVQEHFGHILPFAGLFAEIGEKQIDLTVAMLADFVEQHLGATQTSLAHGHSR